MLSTLITTILALSAITNARPQRRDAKLTAADIIKIDPDTTSCEHAPQAGECAAASDAVSHILSSFDMFQVESFGTQAALVSLMLYESGSFKYNKNHFPAPGNPGQGTRNMMMPNWVAKYAEWLEENCHLDKTKVDAAKSNPAALLDLVNTEDWSFWSAAWFLKTQCSLSIAQGLAAQTEEGWNTYLKECLGTTVTADRTAIWKKAIALKAW